MSGANQTKVHHAGDVDNGRTVTLAAKRRQAGDEPSQLPRAVETYLAELETGRHLDREQFIARYPEIADELRKCLDGLELIHRAGHQLSSAERSPSSAAGDPATVNATLGDFRILREIGRGGMGVVYEAEQISLPRRVALKVLPFAGVLDPRQLERFKNESRAAATLEHPAIVSVYSVGCERAVHFYAMQYIEGQSVAELIAQLRGDEQPDPMVSEGSQATSRFVHGESQPCECQAGKATVERAADVTPTHRTTGSSSSSTPVCGFESTQNRNYFRNVARLGVRAAEALDHAHARGIVHRDIKPGNLLLDAEGNVYVADFGLARIEADPGMTMTGDILGTLRYMSPEQALAKRAVVDHRSDIYSLGAMLYELVTLTPPFTGDDRQELLRKIGSEEPELPSKLNKSIPRDLETIILTAIAKSPVERYGTAAAFAQDLHNFGSNLPIAANRPSVGDRLKKLLLRHQTVVLSLAVVLLVTGVLSVVSSLFILHYYQSEKKQRVLAQSLQVTAQKQAQEAEQQRHRAESLLYATNMRLAGEAWRSGDVTKVRELLEVHLPASEETDLRGFEWHFLDHANRMNVEKLFSYDSPLYDVDFSPDQRWIAIAGADGVVRLHDAKTKQLRWHLEAEQDEVNAVAFSLDGKRLATAGDDGTVKLWRIKKRKHLLTLQAHDLAFDVCFSPVGNLLASAGENGLIMLWDHKSGELLGKLRGHTHAVERIAISADGKRLLSAGHDRTARLWDLDSMQELIVVKGNGPITSVFFAPHGPWFATISKDGKLDTWHIETGKRVAVFPRSVHHTALRSLAISGDGRWAATGDSSGEVRMWHFPGADGLGASAEVERQTDCQDIACHRGRVYGLAFSPNNRQLISVAQDGQVMRIEPKVPIDHFQERQTPRRPTAQVAVGQQDLIAVCNYDGIHFVRPSDGKVLDTLSNELRGWSMVATDPQGQYIAAYSHESVVSIWEIESRKEIRHLKLDNVSHIEFVPGHEMVGVNANRELRLFDLHQEELSYSLSTKAGDFSFFPKIEQVALALHEENEIEVWDWAARRHRYTLHGNGLSLKNLCIDPTGHFLAASDSNNHLLVWDLEGRELLFSIIPHDQSIRSIQFTPDGKSILTAGDDGYLRISHVASGQHLFALQESNGHRIISGLLSPSGRYLTYIDEGYRSSHRTLCFGMGAIPE